LAGFTSQVRALTERGGFSELTMPVSVAVADMNGDKKTDIVAADPAGYFRIYFNEGEGGAAKFTHGELLPLFFSRSKMPSYRGFEAPKIALGDFGRSGKLDLVVGTYSGAILLFPNAGSPAAPDYRQQDPITKSRIEFTKLPEGWGNLLAPAAADLNRDGKLDLLVGEGSYSANAVYFSANQSPSGIPRFDDANRKYLCYGDGREQLHPAVVDYNGDGVSDVLVGDRKGAVGVYLGKRDWKPGDTLEQSSTVSFGSASSLGSAISVAAADMTGDGLFDLVVGKSNGRIALATNIGSKTAPKFGQATDIKGANIGKPTLRLPSAWEIDTQQTEGNFLAMVESVSSEEDPNANPPEGKRALKASFMPSPNQRVPMRFQFIQAGEKGKTAGLAAGPGTITIRLPIRTPPNPGTPIMVRFQHKGAAFKASWALEYKGSILRSITRKQVTERGGVEAEKRDKEELTEGGALNPVANWQATERRMKFQFKQIKELNTPGDVKGSAKPEYEMTILLELELDPQKGAFYLDDVQIVPEA
jgi:hypothetical protein